MTEQEKDKLRQMLEQLDALREQIDKASADAKKLFGELDEFIKEGVGTPQGIGNAQR
jgi:hypothetical protein